MEPDHRRLRLLGGVEATLALASSQAANGAAALPPSFIGRGVGQLSAYIDTVLASFLARRAVAQMAYAQALYLLPVSLFGMWVSAAELPAMSSAVGKDEEVAAYLRQRLHGGSAASRSS